MKYIVVGAGFSGLITSYYLCRAGHEAEIYEKSERAGGLIRSIRSEWGLIETAANGMLFQEELEELESDLDIRFCRMKQESAKRFIYRKKPRRWPLNLTESFAFLARLPKILRIKHKYPPQKFESVADWGQKVFGKKATDYLLAPALNGIYAGDHSQMSANLIFSPLLNRKKKRKTKRRGTVAPPNGMGELIDKLVVYLEKKNVKIHYNTSFALDQLKDEEELILCSNPKAAAQIVQPKYEKLSHDLAKIKMIPLVSVTLFFSKQSSDWEGFGCLFPREGNSFRVLGILNNNNIFPNRSEHRSETWILGGCLDQEIIDFSDQEIIELIAKEREEISGIKQEPLYHQIQRWPEAIPHYDLTLERVLQELEVPEGIHLMGNYLGGIGLTKILSKAKVFSESIAKKS